MASIRKRGEFQWQARVIRKGEKLISKTFTTKQAAEDWATAIETEVTAEDFVDVRPLSKFKLRDLLDDMPRTTIPQRKGRVAVNFPRVRPPIACSSMDSICASCLSSTGTRTYIAQHSGRNTVLLAESVISASINSIIPEAAVDSQS